MKTAGMCCKYCGSEDIGKAGKRVGKSGEKQIYHCRVCLRRFSNQNKLDKNTPAEIILRSVILVCRGYSYGDIIHIIEREFRRRISRGTITKWIREFDPPYLKISHYNKDLPKLISAFCFTHRNLNYDYQLHRGKLRVCRRWPELVSYLENAPALVKPEMFEQSVRCSQQQIFPVAVLTRKEFCPLSRLVMDALPAARSNRRRHQVVEDYLLACDRDTIACEVPVYYYDKQLGPICGHIDLLQVNFGKLWVLDYKPNARRENKAKVATQLLLYARALMFRAKVPLAEIRCAFFDERDWFEFSPDGVTLTPPPKIGQ